jgi:hypothetical protein
MRACRLAGLAITICVAVSLILVSTALAAAEFRPIPEKKGFETKSGKSVLTADYGLSRITCSSSTSTGEITGAKTVGKVLVAFRGCTSTGIGGSGCPVESTGAKSGEVRTSLLKGELGTVAPLEAFSERALVLRPETGRKFSFIEGNPCTEEVVVTGTIAGEVESVDIRSVRNGLVFKVAGGEQMIGKVKVATGEVHPELEAFGTTATESTNEEWEVREEIEIT